MVPQPLITEPKYKGGSGQVEITEPKFKGGSGQVEITEPGCRDESGQVETSNQWGKLTVSLATKKCGPHLLGAFWAPILTKVIGQFKYLLG